MDLRTIRMESEFDQYLLEMKPFLLNLPHRSDRQRCALWIKKLCEPVGSSAARKNRNLYCKLLLRMLKRGNIEGPFAIRPESGPLKSLPSYMCMFLDETKSSSFRTYKDINVSDDGDFDYQPRTVPDWLKSELPGALAEVHYGGDENALPNEYDTYIPKLSGLPQHFGPEKSHNIGGSLFPDDRSVQEKEMDIKIKLLEAEFHEEKLNMQHKHDLALQKVLSRKNTEIDDLKRHYKGKEKDNDEAKRKLEKKVQSVMKDAQAEREVKERQIEDLTSLVEETRQSLQGEYEAKVNDVLGNMEKEKYELQKMHTQNIQELLDDTNQRLQSMEDEYNSQTQATKLVVSELEHHVTQLTQETETLANNKQLLITEKQQLEMENNRLQSDVNSLQRKSEELQQELATIREEYSSTVRNMQNKHDANVEYLKQDQKVTSAKNQETIRELEDQIQTLKHALQDSGQQRTRELREKESLHQQDIMSLQHLHEKQVHNLRSEWDQDRLQQNRTVKSLEDTLRDKDDQIVKLTIAQKQCMSEAEKAIEVYKKQASEAQQKVYADMRSQLEKLESDLEQSKVTREKLQQEFDKQIDEMKERHADELNECRLLTEQDKVSLNERLTTERDNIVKEYEGQLSLAESRLRDALEQQEKIAEERRAQNQQVVNGLEQQIRDLREELVSANALRRQQLVELGLLREEERQKTSREHDIAVAKLEAEIDRQRMELHQQHASEMEKHTLKMKKKIEQIEEDYRQRLERSHERLLEAQNKEASSREMMIQNKNDSDEQILGLTARLEEEKNNLKLQHNAMIRSAQSDLEKMREEQRLQQRQFQQSEFDFKNQLSRVKLECEERMKGMIPKSLKDDLEDTIACLRSQIKSLQQRVEVLQEENEVDRSFLSSHRHSPLLMSSH